MNDSDGINEMFSGHLQVAVTVAARLGEQLMRLREKRLRELQAQGEQQAREAQQRFNAERAAARAELSPVLDDRWWQKAGLPAIRHAYEVASAWKEHEPLAERVHERMTDELKERHGIVIGDADPRAVFIAAEEEATRRAEAAKLQAAAAQDTQEARAFMIVADDYDQLAAENRQLADGLLDRTSYKDPGPIDEYQMQQAERNQAIAVEHEGARDEALSNAADRYDSAERRATLVAQLEGNGRTPQEIQARIAADLDQGKPARDAVKKKTNAVPTRRKASGRFPERAQERSR